MILMASILVRFARDTPLGNESEQLVFAILAFF
jgi:hypothetical protein